MTKNIYIKYTNQTMMIMENLLKQKKMLTINRKFRLKTNIQISQIWPRQDKIKEVDKFLKFYKQRKKKNKKLK